MPGRIILLNGASSSGKSTLASRLQGALDDLFWHFSIDHLRSVLPQERIRDGDFDWARHREAFFEGFHRTLPVLAAAGNDLIVEHIVETPAWRDRLAALLAGIDVFLVGVHCPLDELERREASRGDRGPGEARADWERDLHAFMRYDVEVSCVDDVEHSAQKILVAWRARRAPAS